MSCRIGLFLMVFLTVTASGAAQVAAPGATDPLAVAKADPQIAAAIHGISPAKVKEDIAKLVSFGTRSTLSSMDTDLPPGHGINVAADWIESEFKAISEGCGGCLEVKRDEFTENPAPAGERPNRFARPTKLTNVYAIMHGTATDKNAPWVLVTGHYDSRVTDVMDSHSDAPGANDDASGVAAVSYTHLTLPTIYSV